MLKQIQDTFWGSIRHEPAHFAVGSPDVDPDEVFTLVPLASSFDRPIGYVWVVTKNAQSDSVTMILESAATLIVLAVRAAVASSAIRLMATPVWGSASTTEAYAHDVASTCVKALGCAGVLIWEVKAQTGNLKTLAAVKGPGNGRPIPATDMPVGKGIAGHCAEDNATIVIDDLLDADELSTKGYPHPQHPDIVRQEGWRSAILVPLDIGGRAAGVLAAYAIRPRAFFQLDVTIASAVAQRFCAGYVHIDRMARLSEMEAKLALEASAIEAGMLAMERVHDAANALLLAQGALSEITGRFRHDLQHPVYKSAAAAGSYVDRANKTIKAIVNRAKTKHVRLNSVNVYDLLKDTIDPVRIQAQTVGVSISVRCPRDLRMKCDTDLLPRLFLNLLNNSLFFLETDTKPGERQILIDVASVSDEVQFRVWDNGPGISPYDRAKVFDAFFTTKSHKGMGFGLAIAKDIVNAHNGRIDLHSEWGVYTEFIITIPLVWSKDI
jgi:signal transduction histidine kinase